MCIRDSRIINQFSGAAAGECIFTRFQCFCEFVGVVISADIAGAFSHAVGDGLFPIFVSYLDKRRLRGRNGGNGGGFIAVRQNGGHGGGEAQNFICVLYGGAGDKWVGKLR